MDWIGFEKFGKVQKVLQPTLVSPTWFFPNLLIAHLIKVILYKRELQDISNNKCDTKIKYDYNIGTVVNILKYVKMALCGQGIQDDICNTIFKLSLYSSLCSVVRWLVSKACMCSTD